MKRLKLVVIMLIIGLLYYYSTEIINFIQYPIFWKFKIWMLGVWGIWKCQYYIWQSDQQTPHSDEDTGRTYRSMEEARYKEVKHQMQSENVGREINVENWTDENGKPYFIIRVIHELGEILFIPFEKK